MKPERVLLHAALVIVYGVIAVTFIVAEETVVKPVQLAVLWLGFWESAGAPGRALPLSSVIVRN